LLNKLKPKSEFSRNVLTLMTGTTIAQAIPIAISPILTRIYTPEDFGVVALFMAIVMIFGSIISARYEFAIMLPEKETDAINLVALSILIMIIISFTLFMIIIFNIDLFTKLLKNNEIRLWLYFIPLIVFFLGLFNILNYYNTRLKNYKDISSSMIIKSIVLVTVQLSVGFIKSGATGLISGQILASLFANLKLLKNTISKQDVVSYISLKNMLTMAKRYKKFPIFSTWSGLLNTSIQNFQNILMPLLFGYANMGFYTLGQRVLGLPLTLISKSLGQVFFQKASEQKRERGNSREIFILTLTQMILLGFIIFIPLFFIIEPIISFVFGENWIKTAYIIQILIPLFFIRFITSSLSTSLIVYEKQKAELFINVILLVTMLLIIFLNQNNFISFLKFYSFFMSLNYIILLLYLYRLSLGDKK